MSFIETFVISVKPAKGLKANFSLKLSMFQNNPILSFGGKEPLIELFTILIADINSLTDVGIYAGALPQITYIFLSEYWIKYFLCVPDFMVDVLTKIDTLLELTLVCLR